MKCLANGPSAKSEAIATKNKKAPRTNCPVLKDNIRKGKVTKRKLVTAEGKSWSIFCCLRNPICDAFDILSSLSSLFYLLIDLWVNVKSATPSTGSVSIHVSVRYQNQA